MCFCGRRGSRRPHQRARARPRQARRCAGAAGRVRPPRELGALCAVSINETPPNPRASPTPGLQRPLQHAHDAWGRAPGSGAHGDSQYLTVTSFPALEATDVIPKCLKLDWREGAPPAGLLGLFRSQPAFEPAPAESMAGRSWGLPAAPLPAGRSAGSPGGAGAPFVPGQQPRAAPRASWGRHTSSHWFCFCFFLTDEKGRGVVGRLSPEGSRAVPRAAPGRLTPVPRLPRALPCSLFLSFAVTRGLPHAVPRRTAQGRGGRAACSLSGSRPPVPACLFLCKALGGHLPDAGA